jgi:hypothetical protein
MVLDEKIYKFYNNIPKMFFEIIQKKSLYYKMILDEETLKTHKVEIQNIKTKKFSNTNCYPFGALDTKSLTWHWYQPFRNFMLNFIKEKKIKNEILDEIFKKDKFKVNKKYQEFIPYYFAFTKKDDNKINLIRFESEDGKIISYFDLDLNLGDKKKILKTIS